MKKVIAVDIGASNGRLISVQLEEHKLYTEEIHRFPNQPYERNGYLFWDVNYFFREIKQGLKKFTSVEGNRLLGIGVDTWGVDVGFISREDELVEDPYSYRNTHTAERMKEVHVQLSDQRLFERTGVESASINTLYQLYDIFKQRPELLKETGTILTMPSLVNFLLTGKKKNEFTHMSTTQLMNWRSKGVDEEIISTVFQQNHLPFAEIAATNSVLGKTKLSVNQDVGMEAVSVINVPGHDTACALAAMPLQDDKTVFMSCGTWVLIGIEVEQPVVNEKAYKWGFTNEGTINNSFRLQKNNMGLWLLQQCKKEWEAASEAISYKEADLLIEKSVPFQTFIDPDHHGFFNPDSMVKQIQGFCKDTGQYIPTTKGEILRCILESLALKYRYIIDGLEGIAEQGINSIHMAGGGIQNRRLCQFTASATNRHVRTGPVEASAIGNALAQFIALGEINDLEEARKVVAQSFEMNSYQPQNHADWNTAYKRFCALLTMEEE